MVEDDISPAPWNENEGKFGVPSSSVPQRLTRKATIAIDPVIETRALRGIEAIPAAEPVTVADEADDDVVVADRLRQIVERLEALKEQAREIASMARDVRSFAKAIGFDGKAITAILKMREMEPRVRMDFEAIIETYRHALGIEGPDFASALPARSVDVPPPVRKLTAKEKQYREVLALQSAERATEQTAVGLLPTSFRGA